MARDANRASSGVVVIGLGRFGKSLALELIETEGTDVLAIDANPKEVDAIAGQLTQAVEADSTDEAAMRQLSVHEFDRAVIGIGTNLEASILTASVLVGFEIPSIWAKAISHSHARILSQLGVQHVVRPEHDMGKRVAHLVRGRMLDYIEFDDGYAVAKTSPPSAILDQRLADTSIRSRYGVTVVGVKRAGEDFTYATAETVLDAEDLILVSGKTRGVERFSDLT